MQRDARRSPTVQDAHILQLSAYFQARVLPPGKEEDDGFEQVHMQLPCWQITFSLRMPASDVQRSGDVGTASRPTDASAEEAWSGRGCCRYDDRNTQSDKLASS